MTRRCRRWTIGLALSAAVLAGLYRARQRVLPSAARWLDVGQAPARADYVMVLGGSPQNRPLVAAALVKAGLASQVLVSHTLLGPAVRDGILPPEDEIVRRVLVRRGVPPSSIQAVGDQSASTYDEAQALAALLCNLGDDVRVTIVTSDFHTRRARWIFRQELGSRAGQFAMISAPTEEFGVDDWWQSDAGFVTIAGENLKLLLYVGRYSRWFHLGAAGLVLAGIAAWYRRRRRSSERAAQVTLRAV